MSVVLHSFLLHNILYFCWVISLEFTVQQRTILLRYTLLVFRCKPTPLDTLNPYNFASFNRQSTSSLAQKRIL